MKICVASSGFGHIARGVEAWACDLGYALAMRNQAVTLCKGGGEVDAPIERSVHCWQRNSAKAQRLNACLPRSVGWRLGMGSTYGIEQTTFALALIGHLRRERIDLLHVQDPQLALVIQRARNLGLVKARVILGHGTEESLAFLRKVTYLQHLAPWHLEEARRQGVWKPTWTAIPNFVDCERFSPTGNSLRQELGIPPAALVVMTAAAIKRPHKRIDHLISEFARLRFTRPELPVWLIVAGGWEQETDELVNWGREQLGNRVRFLVGFPRARMPEVYRAADVFILASLFEMQGIALLEAAACGLPCVVHRHPVFEWVVGAGGESIDMSAQGAAADLLAQILSGQERRHNLGAQARQRCLDHFSRDRVVDQILEYYRFVLSHDQGALPVAS